MKTYIRLLLILVVVSFAIGVNAQQNQLLSGSIVGPYGNEPVQGALVSLAGTQETAITDSLGRFSLSVPNLNGVLNVSGNGFYSAEYPLLGRNQLTVKLISLDKMGYNQSKVTPLRTADKLETTNSITINQKNFAPGSMSVDQTLWGAFPGLYSINKSGMPGEGAYINMRGIRSMQGNNAPLIILNGVPYMPDMNESPIIGGYSKSVFNGISVTDIENITLLKGHEASLYGSIGSNGVLLIDTKKATDFKTVVEFSGQYGVASNLAELPVLGVDQFKSYIGDVGLTQYSDMGDLLNTFPFLKDDPDYYYSFLYNNNTDWQDEIFSPAFVMDNNLRIKGGDAVAKYDLSVGFLNSNGTLDNTSMSRYSSRLNANIVLGRKIDMFTSAGFSFITSKLHEQGMLQATNPVLAALYQAPLLSPYKKDVFNNQLPGYDVVRQFNVSNPSAVVNTIEMGADVYDFNFNTGINYRLTDDFKLTGTLGLYYNFNREGAFIPGKTYKTIVPLQEGVALNTSREGIGEAVNYYGNINGQYKKQLGNNMLNASVGLQTLVTTQEYDAGQGINTASDFYKTLDYVTQGKYFWGYIDEWNWMNMYAHVDYSFMNMFTASVNASYDAASSTGEDAQRWGFFPSAGLTWYAKNIELLKDVSFLDQLNVRAEYGVSGNSRFSARTSKYYYVGQKYRDLSGIVRGNIPNTNLKWETTKTLDFGVDIALFGNKVLAKVDYYQILTSDVIMPSAISPEFGIESIFYNQGEISNKGIDMSLLADVVRTKDWGFTLGGNICFNKNRLESMGSNTELIQEFGDGSAVISRVGESVYSFYGYKTNGVIASAADAAIAGVNNSPLYDYKGQAFAAGDMRFADLSGSDGIINKADRTIIGSAEPDFFGGLFANVRYKSFDLAANFTYSVGNQMYNAVRRSLESMDNYYNQSSAVVRRWQTDGQQTDMPKAAYGDPMENGRFSDRWIEDASYLRLSSLTLSYSIKPGVLKFTNGGTLFLTGENLYTLSEYLGYDPATAYSYDPMRQGFDYGKVPLAMTVKLGFKLQF